ncbi:hypothetical protein QBC43DRAFT_287370 [Cladorrhinum sp. PSN259]|nr:hypothetical protein QBC43DRAFT_287370 [Cladorrhinum sp. PSN259]
MDPHDQTFMTIHNLTPDANICFASDSVYDILGYTPDEVKNKSCFEFFHPEEVPFARAIHNRGLLMDKAAVLHYARILAKNGRYVNCECCFTVVHNVLVASTSIYLPGEKSERRAREAPKIRRIFSSSPLDPRYHMLEHLSPKFRMPAMEREPRAALILNRFTRSLRIMYATDAVQQILGLQPSELLEKSFYECIQSTSLAEAVKCLESAKANESIAYLRFSFKDPRIDLNNPENEAYDEEEEDEDDGSMDDNGGSASFDNPQGKSGQDSNAMDIDDDASVIEIKEEDDEGDDKNGSRSRSEPSCPSTTATSSATVQQSARTFELEAVVSCTSDGLVVVLRKARPPIPNLQPALPSAFNYENGLFAAPWGQQPIQPYISPDLLYTFRPPFLPEYMPLRENVKAAGGPPLEQLMRSIRDVAVFAWALSGINGNMATYGHGLPRRGAQPPDGLPIWEPQHGAGPSSYRGSGKAIMGRSDDDDDFPRSAYAYNARAAVAHHEPAIHQGYVRTRHASLDEGMYDDHQRQAPWPPPTGPYRYGNEYEARHPQHPLRSAASHDALHDHGRYQHQPGYYHTAPHTMAAASSRCNAPQEPSWEEGSSSSRTCVPGYRTQPPYHGESSSGSSRYYWQ